LIFLPGIARCFGSDADGKAIRNVMFARVTKGVKKINETLAQGGDPKNIETNALWAAGSGNGRMFRDSLIIRSTFSFRLHTLE
jgi:hypothetical protein